MNKRMPIPAKQKASEKVIEDPPVVVPLEENSKSNVEPELFSVVCGGETFKVNKNDLKAASERIKFLLEQDDGCIEFNMELQHRIVIKECYLEALKVFMAFLKNKIKPTFKNRHDYIEVLKLATFYRMKEFYHTFAKENLVKYFNRDTFFEFVDVAPFCRDYEPYMVDLIALLNPLVKDLYDIIVESANGDQFRTILYHYNGTDPDFLMRFITQWIKNDPGDEIRIGGFEDILDYANLSRFDYKTLPNYLKGIRIFKRYPNQKEIIIKKMMLDQTRILVCHGNKVDVYGREDSIYIVLSKEDRWEIPSEYRVLKAFSQGKFDYIVACNEPDKFPKTLSLWRKIGSEEFEKKCDLLSVKTDFYVYTVGHRLLIVIPSTKEKSWSLFKTSIISYDVVKLEFEFMKILEVPFLTNEILCSRSYLYLFHVHKERKTYFGILRFDLEKQTKRLFSLLRTRVRVYRWERATCANDRLVIFSFYWFLPKGTPYDPECNYITTYKETLERNGQWVEEYHGAYWKCLQQFLDFHDQVKDEEGVYYPIYPYINFFGDNKFIYGFNHVSSVYERMFIRFEPDIPLDNMTLVVRRK